MAGPISNTVMWLGRASASNPTMAKAVEWSIAAHGAVIGALWFGKSDQTASTPIEAKIVIAPKKDQQTVNPDAKRYEDTPSASDPLQPAPKTSYSTAATNGTMPSTQPAVLNLIGAPATAQFESGNYWIDVATYEMQAGYSPGAHGINSTYFSSQDSDGRSKQYSRLKPDGPSPCGSSGQVNCIYQVIYSKSTLKSCAAGYSLSGGNCVLNNAAQVTKPAGTVACEITRKSDNTWYIDPKNPECASLASSITQSADGKKLTVSNGSGQSATVTDNDDGTRDYDFQDGDTWRNIKAGPYDSGLGGRPITSITDGGGTNPGGTAGTPGTGTGGTGSGSGGSCGGSGQPPCAIDDSGFDGMATDGDGLAGKVDAHDQSIKDRLSAINPADKHGMDWTWLPSIPRVACTPFEFGKGGKVITIDLCKTFEVIRQALGWLLYIFMAWGLFDLLMSGTTTKGRK